MDLTTAEPEMSDQANTNTTAASGPTESMDSFWLTFLGVVPLLGLAPLMAVEALRIWDRPHYRFAPLAFLAAIALIAVNFRDARPDRKRFLVATIIGTIGCLLGLCSIWFFMPQLAHLSLAIVLYGWLLGQLGETRWSRILALVSLIVVTIPWPFHLDISAMRTLQAAAAKCTSYALDALGVMHLLSGTAISGRYFTIPTTRVAGGPDSFFLFLGLATIFIAARRHGVLATLLLLASVPIWSITYGVISQTVLGIYGNSFIASGHELPFLWVRAIVFVVVVISFVLFEIGLLGLTRPAKWSRLVDDEWLIEDEIMRYRPPIDYTVNQTISRSLSLPLSSILLLAGLSSALMIARYYDNAFASSRSSLQAANEIGNAAALPAQVGDWKRSDFWIDTNLSSSGSVVPQFHWRYTRGLENVTLALTLGTTQLSPIDAYQQQKWRVVEEADAGSNEVQLPYQLVQLRNSLGGQAFLMLSDINIAGEVVPASLAEKQGDSPWRSIFTKLASDNKAQNRHVFEAEAFYPAIAEQKQVDSAAASLVTALLQAVAQQTKTKFASSAAPAAVTPTP
jgi:hypothetical protein